MKKSLFLLLLPIQLNWGMFRGEPKPEHTAMSAIHISYYATELGDGRFKFDSAVVEFDSLNSYTRTSDLYTLRHEQLHIDLAQTQVNYINKVARGYTYSKENYEVMIEEMTKRWKKEDDRYDFETNHSINKIAQQRWDLFIAKELAK